MTDNPLEIRPLGGTFVKPMLELFMLLVLLIVASDPAFNVSGERLPQLTQGEGGTAAPGGGRPRLEMHLRLDGSALWGGQPVPCEELARCVAQHTTPQDTVALIVETREGAGPVEALLQTQLDCSRLRVWDRVRVLHRPAAPPAGAPGRPTP